MALMTALTVLSLSCLLVIVAVAQLEDQILPNVLLRLLVQLGAFTVMCLATLALLVLSVWQLWLRWTVKVSDGPTADGSLASVLNVHLDPQRGLVMNVLDRARIIPVLVNPEYWHLLPSSALSKGDGLESAVLGSVLTSVNPKSEPASLVALSNGQEIVGMGSRVRFRGKSYLLTASHVWHGASEKMYLAKHGVQAQVSTDAPIGFECGDLSADFVLVDIPDRIWSRLEVKAAPLSVMEKQAIVMVYGGKDTLDLVCSSGRANKGEYSHQIVHSCTTTNGWSGSPLYYKGAVVGIHCGSKDFGVSNRGVNVGLLVTLGLETVFSEISNTLIDEEEARNRDYEFKVLEITGQGKYAIGKGEYYVPNPNIKKVSIVPEMKAFEASIKSTGRTLWSEDDDTFYDSLETLSSHLNAKRAELPQQSPPSFLLATTSGSEEISSQKEVCRCTKLVDRVCNLEKLLEKLLELQSSPQPRSSPNSQNLIGPKEAPTPNSDPSCSKQEGSKKRRSRKRSKKPAEGSESSTQSQCQEAASEGKTGTTATSRRRLRRSAKAMLTSTPPPVSLSASSAQQTERS